MSEQADPPAGDVVEQPGTAVVTTPKAELVIGGDVTPIIPRNVEEVARFAKMVLIAGLAPDSYTKNVPRDEIPAKIAIGIMKGAEIGLAPLTALANIAIINGRACLWGDGAVALVHRSGKVKNWVETYEGEPGKDDYTAVCKIWRVGQEDPYIGKFSIGDARRAKLLSKGPWVEYQARMMMWRARSYAMRGGFADCLCGLAIAEETQDIPAAPGPVNTAFLEDKSDDQADQPKDGGGLPPESGPPIG